ncbi:hypothetical protein RAZWK3B_05757 [Roseobacter sp. AzwK-3b]|nr:hypothetical protein RAZWK3B_05757 [Roseobacter sp. AzwK-3b]
MEFDQIVMAFGVWPDGSAQDKAPW